MLLNDDELEQLTKRKRRDAQRRVLVALGIEHKVRPDGSLVVLAAHVEKLLGGARRGKVENDEPDWDAIAPAT